VTTVDAAGNESAPAIHTWTVAPLGHLQLFGYYSPDPEQEGHVNFMFWHHRPGLSAILWFGFNVFDPASFTIADIQKWFWQTVSWETFDPAHPENWRQGIGARINSVAAILMTDEPELSGQSMAAFEETVAKTKAALPGVPLWTNFSSAVLAGYQFPAALDWISIDAYTMHPSGFMPALKAQAQPHHKFFLLPPGLGGLASPAPFLDIITDDPQTATANMARAYYEYALTDPRVLGMIVFDWNDQIGLPGTKNMPRVRETFVSIGKEIISGQGGGVPAPSAPVAVPPPPVTPPPPAAPTVTLTASAASIEQGQVIKFTWS